MVNMIVLTICWSWGLAPTQSFQTIHYSATGPFITSGKKCHGHSTGKNTTWAAFILVVIWPFRGFNLFFSFPLQIVEHQFILTTTCFKWLETTNLLFVKGDFLLSMVNQHEKTPFGECFWLKPSWTSIQPIGLAPFPGLQFPMIPS